MMKDPIVEEVRRAREKIFAECDYDLNKLMERIKRAEEKHKDRLVSYEDVHGHSPQSKA